MRFILAGNDFRVPRLMLCLLTITCGCRQENTGRTVGTAEQGRPPSSPSNQKDEPSIAAKKNYTQGEFVALVYGKSRDEVTAAIGKADLVYEYPLTETRPSGYTRGPKDVRLPTQKVGDSIRLSAVLHYDSLVADPMTGKPKRVRVFFDEYRSVFRIEF